MTVCGSSIDLQFLL